MGDFLVPLLILLVVGLVMIGASRLMKKKSKADSGLLATVRSLREPVTEGQARDAAAKLSVENHKTIYGLIAQGNHHGAAEKYAEMTGSSFIQSVTAIAALSNYPQAHPDTEDFAEESEDSFVDDSPVEDSIKPDTSDFMIPESWQEQGAARTPSFELQVSREDETLRISSDDLGPWVQDQLSAMVRDDDVEQGTQLLVANTELNEAEARQFLEIVIERKREGDS